MPCRAPPDMALSASALPATGQTACLAPGVSRRRRPIEAVRNIESIEAAFGGSVENVNVLIQTEVTDDRAIRNMLDFADAFFDDLRRPEGVVGGIQSSLGLLFEDWITDDGTEGDNYDPEPRKMALAANEFRLDPAQIQSIIDRLEEIDSSEFA